MAGLIAGGFVWARRDALGKQRRKPMRRERKILGQVVDVEGGLWDVRQIRETKHGFDLLFGSPVSHLESYCGGLPRLIATKELKDYWESNRTKCEGECFDLPAGRTTLKRLRKRLGFNCLKDVAKFWRDRIEDLRTLPAREFAARHGVHVAVVLDVRFRLLGRQARELNWWHDPQALEALRSDETLGAVGKKLGISKSHVFRLRARVEEMTAKEAMAEVVREEEELQAA